MKIVKSLIVATFVFGLGMGVMWLAGGDDSRFAGNSLLVMCGLLAFAVNWLAFIPAALAKTEKYYDFMGMVTYVSVTIAACYFAQPLDLKAMIVAAMVLVWSIRLGTFLFARLNTDGHDRRFEKIKVNPPRFFVTWSLQGLWVTLTAACAMMVITSATRTPIDAFFVLGAIMWLAGFIIEVVADNQKKAFRSAPENKHAFIQTGLWSWSRHPNYFGEILLWVGIFVIALPMLKGAGYVLIISPVFVYLLLTRVSGIPMLASSGKKRWGDDPMYQAYIKRTSLLLPRPPKAQLSD